MICNEVPQPSSATLPGSFTKYSFPKKPLCYSRKYPLSRFLMFSVQVNDPVCHSNRKQCSAWRNWAPRICCLFSCEWEWSRRSRGVRSPGITWASYYISWCSRESWASRISSRGLYSLRTNGYFSLVFFANEHCVGEEWFPTLLWYPAFSTHLFWRSFFTWVYL